MVTIIKNYLACKHCLAELCYKDTPGNPDQHYIVCPTCKKILPLKPKKITLIYPVVPLYSYTSFAYQGEALFYTPSSPPALRLKRSSEYP